MQTQIVSCTEVAETSRLLIHAGVDDGGDARKVESLLQRIRAHVLNGPRDERSLLALEIHDLHGQKMLALDGARPTVDVALPPGTYHVSAQRRGTRRCYTITLLRGTCFELTLRLAGDRR